MEAKVQYRTHEDLETLSTVLDSKFRGPFGTRFGWDGILGLVPGVGDVATTAASAYIIARAAMIGVSFSVLLRMVGNVLVDNLIDLVPFFGWVADFAWKSNVKNLNLLRRYSEDPVQLEKRSRWVVISWILGLLLFLGGLAVLTTIVAWKILQWAYALIS